MAAVFFVQVWKVGRFMVGRLDWGGEDGQPRRRIPKVTVQAKETYRKVRANIVKKKIKNQHVRNTLLGYVRTVRVLLLLLLLSSSFLLVVVLLLLPLLLQLLLLPP